MSSGTAKRLRRTIRKEINTIKIQGLDEFLQYAANQKLRKRIIFGLRILFKKVKI